MSGVLWASPQTRAREWALAKEKLISNGELLPNGSKLRRQDCPGHLSHSFMIVDNQILAVSGKRIYLGSGVEGAAKLAENEAGHLIALKIGYYQSFFKEADIAHDLGVSTKAISRQSSRAQGIVTKYYIPYQYLGITLLSYMKDKNLSLDERYELCIKIALELHKLHSGSNSKSGKTYTHRDITAENIVIDDEKEIHFIDYGRAEETKIDYENDIYVKNDIVKMLLLFFRTVKQRKEQIRPFWIFGDCLAIEGKTSEGANTLNQENRKGILFDLLKNSTDFYGARATPTAIDIAELLTLSRLDLEAYVSVFTQRSLDERLEAIQILNVASTQLFVLYEKLINLPEQNSSLNQIIQDYVVAYCIDRDQLATNNSLAKFNTQLEQQAHLNDAEAIRQCIDKIRQCIDDEKTKKSETMFLQDTQGFTKF